MCASKTENYKCDYGEVKALCSLTPLADRKKLFEISGNNRAPAKAAGQPLVRETRTKTSAKKLFSGIIEQSDSNGNALSNGVVPVMQMKNAQEQLHSNAIPQLTEYHSASSPLHVKNPTFKSVNINPDGHAPTKVSVISTFGNDGKNENTRQSEEVANKSVPAMKPTVTKTNKVVMFNHEQRTSAKEIAETSTFNQSAAIRRVTKPEFSQTGIDNITTKATIRLSSHIPTADRNHILKMSDAFASYYEEAIGKSELQLNSIIQRQSVFQNGAILDNIMSAFKRQKETIDRKITAYRLGSINRRAFEKVLENGRALSERQNKLNDLLHFAIGCLQSIVTMFKKVGTTTTPTEPAIIFTICINVCQNQDLITYLSTGDIAALSHLYPWLLLKGNRTVEAERFIRLYDFNGHRKGHFGYRIEETAMTTKIFHCIFECFPDRHLLPIHPNDVQISYKNGQTEVNSLEFLIEMNDQRPQAEDQMQIASCQVIFQATQLSSYGVASEKQIKGTAPLQSNKLNKIVVSALSENTEYEVKATIVCRSNIAIFNFTLKNKTAAMRSRAMEAKKMCKQVEKEAKYLYALPIARRNTTSNVIRKIVGNPKIQYKTSKAILFVGATGTGKTTLINALTNYLYEVQFEDEFRFEVITKRDEKNSSDQTVSQTVGVTVYEYNDTRLPYRLLMIDTPGFCDTGGFDNDRKTYEYIKDWMNEQTEATLLTLDAICVVIKSSETKFTPEFAYQIKAVEKIFGNNVRQILTTMLTFYSPVGQPSGVPDLLREGGLLEGATKFECNSIKIMEKPTNSSDVMSRAFWNFTIKSYNQLFAFLNERRPVNMLLSFQVLENRSELEQQAIMLSDQFDRQMDRTKRFREAIKNLERFKISIVKEAKRRGNRWIAATKQIPLGIFTTYCNVCYYTCHASCPEVGGHDTLKFNCDVMTNKGSVTATCSICPEKCSWKVHFNTNFTVEWFEANEDQKEDEINAEKKSALQNLEQEFDRIAKDLINHEVKVGKTIKSIKEIVNNLKKIALSPGLAKSSEYLRHCIEQEKLKGGKSSLERLKILHKHLKITEAIEEAEIDGKLKNAAESAAIAYLKDEFPVLHERLLKKGYFRPDNIQFEKKIPQHNQDRNTGIVGPAPQNSPTYSISEKNLSKTGHIGEINQGSSLRTGDNKRENPASMEKPVTSESGTSKHQPMHLTREHDEEDVNRKAASRKKVNTDKNPSANGKKTFGWFGFGKLVGWHKNNYELLESHRHHRDSLQLYQRS